MDKILILDFGSQSTQLIGRRIRDMGVYTEIIPGDAPLDDEMLKEGLRGIILSGSPESVYAGGPAPDKKVYACGLPLLGICYGLQRMTADLGGRVEALPEREYGRTGITMLDISAGGKGRRGKKTSPAAAFLAGFVPSFSAWMSHGDTLTVLAPGFVEAGTSAAGFPAVVVHQSCPWFGVQFHPELSHCQGGGEILAAFVFAVCGCTGGWTMERYVQDVRSSLGGRVGDNPVLLLISGGVDSTVAAALLLETLGPERVHLLYMDTGLMRKGETRAVRAGLERLGAEHIHVIFCEAEFFGALKGLADPEAKRRAIGDLFISIQEREVVRLGLSDSYFLAQGTLYTDLIESGKGVGRKARLIKSHHNVGSPLVQAKRETGRLLEPLDRLYKDEVRRLGKLLGVDGDVLGRHPFPGPALAVRIVGEVNRERCAILREADAIFIEELKARRGPSGRSLYEEIWQAFAVLLPVRSVGVAGDARSYGQVLALRAITSEDGMSADVYPFASGDLFEIAARITNSVPEVGRVVYDISSKPPATIEWE
jgi:GMP synthase (glutamine-hydrolysing)